MREIRRIFEVSSEQELCPEDGREIIKSRFDATFRLPDGTERLSFGIPGSLCEKCKNFFFDPDMVDILGLPDGYKCTFVIESAPIFLERTNSGEPPSQPA